MKKINRAVLLWLLLNSACNSPKQVQFGTAYYGSYGETIKFDPDSTFTFKMRTSCFSETLESGKFIQKDDRLFLYDVEKYNQLLDTKITIDTQYFKFPNGIKRIIFQPDTTYIYFGDNNPTGLVPNRILLKGKMIYGLYNDRKYVTTYKQSKNNTQ